MSKQYELKTLKDILEIPEDRMDDFLPELKVWHQQVHAWRKFFAATADALNMPHEFEVATQGMTWIDDGKRDITVKLEATPAPKEENTHE